MSSAKWRPFCLDLNELKTHNSMWPRDNMRPNDSWYQLKHMPVEATRTIEKCISCIFVTGIVFRNEYIWNMSKNVMASNCMNNQHYMDWSAL